MVIFHSYVAVYQRVVQPVMEEVHEMEIYKRVSNFTDYNSRGWSSSNSKMGHFFMGTWADKGVGIDSNDL